MRTLTAFFFMATILTGCGDPVSIEPLALRASSARLEADLRFLADDLLEGREAGTRGYDLAALYVAEQMRSLGIETGGDDGSPVAAEFEFRSESRRDAHTALRIDRVDKSASKHR